MKRYSRGGRSEIPSIGGVEKHHLFVCVVLDSFLWRLNNLEMQTLWLSFRLISRLIFQTT
jgi:hypothetical protein